MQRRIASPAEKSSSRRAVGEATVGAGATPIPAVSWVPLALMTIVGTLALLTFYLGPGDGLDGTQSASSETWAQTRSREVLAIDGRDPRTEPVRFEAEVDEQGPAASEQS